MSIADQPVASSVIETIVAKNLKVDSRVQRALVPSRVRKLAAVLDLDAIGVLTVSRRGTGENFVIDGQHRLAALAEHGLIDWECNCHVYSGLTLAREAALFRTLNNASRPGPFDDFTKGVVAGDEECVAINDIVTKAGLEVSDQASEGTVRAVVSLRSIYRAAGPTGLADTLKVVTQAWGRRIDAFDGAVLLGVGTVVGRYAGDIDLAVLARKLAKRSGGALALLGDARGMRRFQQSSVARCVAELIVLTYNKGRREDGQLPPL